MGRRRKAPSNDDGDGLGPMAKKAKGALTKRNRASSTAIVKLYPSLTNRQKEIIRDDLKLGSLLDIKCDQLNNPLVGWLSRLYCPKERAFIVPGRGTIPVNEQSVYETMGLPRGSIIVPYHVDYDIEAGLVQELFPEDGNRPKLTKVAEILTNYKGEDAKFKKLWMVYVTCGLLAPTTGTMISNRCYPMLANIENAGEFNLCKFVVDYMHDNLSDGKYNNTCLLFAMLKYIDSLNCDDYVVDLGEGEFGVNIWTRTAVDAIAVLDAHDTYPITFGKLQLKEKFSSKLDVFGGPAGFDKFMSLHTHPLCTDEEKKRIAKLIYDHAVDFNTSMIKLVQGLSSLRAVACDSTANSSKSLLGANELSRGCSQQGEDDVHVEETSSDSESSNENTTEQPISSLKITRPCSRNTRSSRGTSSVATPPVGNTRTESHKAGSIGGSRRSLEHEGASCENDGASVGMGTQASEANAQVIMEKNAGQDGQAKKGRGKMAADNTDTSTVGFCSQTIHIPDSDLSASESGTACDDTVIVESQMSSPNVDNIIRNEAEAMATRLSGLKRRRAPAIVGEDVQRIHGEVKRVVAAELGLLKDTSTVPDPKESSDVLSTPPSRVSKPAGDTPKTKKIKRTPSRRSPRFTTVPFANPIQIQDDVAGAEKGGGRTVDMGVAADAEKEGGRSVDTDGSSYTTAIVISPNPVAHTSKGSQGIDCDAGKSASKAIILSPTVRAEGKLLQDALRKNVLASLFRTPSPIGLSSRINPSCNADGSPFVVSSELKRIVSELSAAVKQKEKGKAVVSETPNMSRKQSKPRDTRPGMFTPPTFHLLSQSSPSSSEYEDMNVDSSPDRDEGISEPIYAPPLAWAPHEDVVDKERKESKLAAYLDGTLDTVDDELAELLDQIEINAIQDHKRLRQTNVCPEGSTKEVDLCSATPKPFARKTRVNKPSRFKSSPFDETFNVTEDQEDVYKKLMFSTSKSMSSNIKGVDIVKYPYSWVSTAELADCMKPKGQLSTRVCDVAIEFIREHFKTEKRVVFPYLIVKHLLDNEFTKKCVLKAFREAEKLFTDCSKSVLDDDIHHWYVVGINMVAKRFEVLDSLRGADSASLNQHSSRVVKKLKEAWSIFYETAKNQIESFETKIIEVPKQTTNDDCGFFMLNNLERWFGQEIPEMQPHHVVSAKKILPYKLLSSHLNATTKWRYHLDNNKL